MNQIHICNQSILPVRRSRPETLIIIGGFYPYSNLNSIIFLYTNESNTPIYSKDNARKPVFERTGRMDVRAGMMLYPLLPFKNDRGITSFIARYRW